MQTTMTVNNSAQPLLKRYQSLLKQQPGKLRARNAAQALGVSEGELIASRVGLDVVRLVEQPAEILHAVRGLGEVMALTRNAYCVHERKGVYDNLSFTGNMGLAVNEDIDLRLFMQHWQSAFAVRENDRDSLQFFDGSGDAVHKIYLTQTSDTAAYAGLVRRFKAPGQSDFLAVLPRAGRRPDRPDHDIDVSALEKAWWALQDTHEFVGLLKRFDVGREQALRLVSDDLACEVPVTSPRRLLEGARDTGCEIMVFVGNRGCIQIHTGPVRQLKAIPDWYNVLDERFNLHLNDIAIARCWVTRKPTVDGMVTALEVFDADGELIVTFFGKRKPGLPELSQWRSLIATLSV